MQKQAQRKTRHKQCKHRRSMQLAGACTSNRTRSRACGSVHRRSECGCSSYPEARTCSCSPGQRSMAEIMTSADAGRAAGTRGGRGYAEARVTEVWESVVHRSAAELEAFLLSSYAHVVQVLRMRWTVRWRSS